MMSSSISRALMKFPSNAVSIMFLTACGFAEKNIADLAFLSYLQDFIERRKREMPEGSYTTKLFTKGVNKISQKVGEEAVETIIEATNGTQEQFLYESADLIYHLIVLLTEKGIRIEDLARELKARHKE